MVTTAPWPETPPAPGGREAVICDCPISFILAMNQRYGLAILREEAAIRNIHQLQHFRIVVQLHRHGMHVLGAGKQQIYGKGVSLDRLNGWRIKQEAGCRPAALGGAGCPAGA